MFYKWVKWPKLGVSALLDNLVDMACLAGMEVIASMGEMEGMRSKESVMYEGEEADETCDEGEGDM